MPAPVSTKGMPPMPIPLLVILALAVFGVFSAGFFTGSFAAGVQGVSGVAVVAALGLMAAIIYRKTNAKN